MLEPPHFGIYPITTFQSKVFGKSSGIVRALDMRARERVSDVLLSLQLGCGPDYFNSRHARNHSIRHW
jgi:hypothetical protein